MTAILDLQERFRETELYQEPSVIRDALRPDITHRTAVYAASLALRFGDMAPSELEDFSVQYQHGEEQFGVGLVMASLTQLARARRHVRDNDLVPITTFYVGFDLDNTAVPWEGTDTQALARDDLRTGLVPAVQLLRAAASRVGVNTKVLVNSDRPHGVLSKEAIPLLWELDCLGLLDRDRIWSVKDGVVVSTLPETLLTRRDENVIPATTLAARMLAVAGYISPQNVRERDAYHERVMPYIGDALQNPRHAYLATDDTGGWTECLDNWQVGALRVLPGWEVPAGANPEDYVRPPLYPTGDHLMYHRNTQQRATKLE